MATLDPAEFTESQQPSTSPEILNNNNNNHESYFSSPSSATTISMNNNSDDQSNNKSNNETTTATTSTTTHVTLALTPDKDYTNPRYNALRVGYLAVFGGLSAFSPFSSVLFEEKGLSPHQTGLLMSFAPVSLLVVIPPVAYLAETNRLQRPFMYISGFASMVLLVAIMLFQDKTTVVVMTLIYFAISAPLLPLYDEHVLAVLSDNNKPQHQQYYGAFRVMGAYSWLVGSLVSSAILNYFQSWDLLTIPVVVGSLVHLLAIYKTPVSQEKGDHKYWEVWTRICQSPALLNFILGITAVGLGYSLVATFLSIFLVGPELNAPPILLGLCTVMTVSIEIPLFRNAEYLHAKFTDEQLFMFSVIGYIVRVFGYSILPNPWLVLFLEPLHGLTFGCMWLSSVSFFKKAFPKTLQNSAVGFVHTFAFGLGPLIGTSCGGFIYEAYGPRNLFRIGGLIVGLVGVVFWVNHKYFITLSKDDDDVEKKQEKRENNKKNRQDDHKVTMAEN